MDIFFCTRQNGCEQRFPAEKLHLADGLLCFYDRLKKDPHVETDERAAEQFKDLLEVAATGRQGNRKHDFKQQRHEAELTKNKESGAV